MNRPTVKTISVRELHELSLNREVVLVDVRTPEEYRKIRAVGARHVPMDRLIPRELVGSRRGDEAEPLYFICHLGGRSHHVCEAMIAAGYPNVVNVLGGMEAWETAGLPVERG